MWTIVYCTWTFDLKVSCFSNLVRIRRAESCYEGISEDNINSGQLFEKHHSNLSFKITNGKCIQITILNITEL